MTTALAPQYDETERLWYCPGCLADVPEGGTCPVCQPGSPGDAQEPPGQDRASRQPMTGRALPRHAGTVALAEPSQVQRPSPGTIPRREHVDGRFVLTQTRAFLKRYAVFPSESALTAVALWVAASHARDEAGRLIWQEFPRLGMLSSEPGSGKSRVLELLQMLCPAAPSIESEPSEAAVALMIGKEHRTLLLDEADVLFGAGRRKAAIRAIINAGYKCGGTWSRVRSGKVESVPVYGALALAGLDVMEKGTGSTLEALLQRFIIIRMRKAVGAQPHKPREVVGEFQGRRITGEDVAARLRELLEAWTAQEHTLLAAIVPEMPDGVELRQEELWASLLAVSQRAGGPWPQMGWEACTDISLYGGTPDVIQENIEMLDSLDWE
jgi:hypothetical protein